MLLSREVGVIGTIADGVLSVLFAPLCAVCGAPVDRPRTSIVCSACWLAVQPVAPPSCHRCGAALTMMRAATAVCESERWCRSCGESHSAIALARALGEYDPPLRKMLQVLKYEGRRSLATELGRWLQRDCGMVLERADCAVPVPLHWRRRWARGFNQAALLADALGPPVVHALRRTRHTASQTTLPVERRQANVRAAFAVRRRMRASIAGACVVLVDDVRTTGATLEACAEALVRAGATEVRALTVARVAMRQPGARRR